MDKNIKTKRSKTEVIKLSWTENEQQTAIEFELYRYNDGWRVSKKEWNVSAAFPKIDEVFIENEVMSILINEHAKDLLEEG